MFARDVTGKLFLPNAAKQASELREQLLGFSVTEAKNYAIRKALLQEINEIRAPVPFQLVQNRLADILEFIVQEKFV
jgi:hypothetical protein